MSQLFASLKRFASLLALLQAGSLWCLQSSVSSHRCHVTACGLKLTPEHGAQIAMIQEIGITESDCLRHFTNVDISGFYCPDERFCGRDLITEYTKELKFLVNKSCSVFAKSEKSCQSLISDLIKSDVNECRASATPCGPGSSCFNKINQGHDCSCYPGYSRIEDWEDQEVECRDINECEQTPDPCDGEFEFCENEPGSFSCPCVSAGFHRPSQESSCVDADECSNNDAKCPSDSEECVNQIGSYGCECKTGFSKNPDHGRCEDVDECSFPDSCPGPSNTCLNEKGSFSCPCIVGFERKTEELHCEDIDECQNTCDEPFRVCENEVGSFACECVSGYRWESEANACQVDLLAVASAISHSSVEMED